MSINIFEQLRDMGDSAPLLYIISTGAGAGIQKTLWEVPGVSNFFVGASFPYDTSETDRVLGFTPEDRKYVNENVAMDLAQTAYIRAWRPGRKAIGLGMTCSVSSLKPHRGDHRIIAAIIGDYGCWLMSVIIPKLECSGRKNDGEIADNIGQEFLNFYINLKWDSAKFPDCKIGFEDGHDVAMDRIMAHPLFLANRTRATPDKLDYKSTIFFPGAFNPPHDGHLKGGEKAVETLVYTKGMLKRLVFSTTINPPHKPELSAIEMLQRAKLMSGHDFLLTENDPLFLDKARKFPGAHFIMGADTMDRFLDPKWGAPIKPMLEEFDSLDTRFSVLGRTIDGVYTTAYSLYSKHTANIGHYSYLFNEVDFRLDVSSSELRVSRE